MFRQEKNHELLVANFKGGKVEPKPLPRRKNWVRCTYAKMFGKTCEYKYLNHHEHERTPDLLRPPGLFEVNGHKDGKVVVKIDLRYTTISESALRSYVKRGYNLIFQHLGATGADSIARSLSPGVFCYQFWNKTRVVEVIINGNDALLVQRVLYWLPYRHPEKPVPLKLLTAGRYDYMLEHDSGPYFGSVYVYERGTMIKYIYPLNVVYDLAKRFSTDPKSFSTSTVESWIRRHNTMDEETNKGKYVVNAEAITTLFTFIKAFSPPEGVVERHPTGTYHLLSSDVDLPDEDKFGMVMPPLLPDPVTPGKSLTNIYASIDGRVQAYARRNEKADFIPFVKIFVAGMANHIGCLAPDTDKEIDEQQNRPTQKAGWEREQHDVQHVSKPASGFTKAESYPCVKPPRNIINATVPRRHQYAAFVQPLSRKLKSFGWCTSVRPAEQSAKIQRVFEKAKRHIVESDLSKMDGTILETLSVLIMQVMLNVYSDEYHEEIKYWTTQMLNASFLHAGAQGEKPGCNLRLTQNSGDPATYLNQTLRKVFMEFVVALDRKIPKVRVFESENLTQEEKHKIRFQRTRDFVIDLANSGKDVTKIFDEVLDIAGVHSGDDGLTPDADVDYCKYVYDLIGLIYDGKVVEQYKDAPMYLGRQYALIGVDIYSVPDTARFVAGLAFNRLNIPVHVHLARKLSGYMITDGQNPFYRELWRKFKDKYKDINKILEDDKALAREEHWCTIQYLEGEGLTPDNTSFADLWKICMEIDEGERQPLFKWADYMEDVMNRNLQAEGTYTSWVEVANAFMHDNKLLPATAPKVNCVINGETHLTVEQIKEEKNVPQMLDPGIVRQLLRGKYIVNDAKKVKEDYAPKITPPAKVLALLDAKGTHKVGNRDIKLDAPAFRETAKGLAITSAKVPGLPDKNMTESQVRKAALDLARKERRGTVRPKQAPPAPMEPKDYQKKQTQVWRPVRQDRNVEIQEDIISRLGTPDEKEKDLEHLQKLTNLQQEVIPEKKIPEDTTPTGAAGKEEEEEVVSRPPAIERPIEEVSLEEIVQILSVADVFDVSSAPIPPPINKHRRGRVRPPATHMWRPKKIE